MTDAVANAKKWSKTDKHGPNQCLRNVREAFGLNANGHEPTAWAAWNAEGGNSGPNTHTHIPAPANVPIFFKHGVDGHVVISAGDGMCWSTDFNGQWVMDGKFHLVTVASLIAHGMIYAGWTETLEGVRIHPHTHA